MEALLLLLILMLPLKTSVQLKDKPFFVYPNPAKNILHVQTHGKTIVSLTDQSGKTLFTQTIEGNGIINIFTAWFPVYTI